MARKIIYVALNGVTGRMGYRQHLERVAAEHPRAGRRAAGRRDGHLSRARSGRAERGPPPGDRRTARSRPLVAPSLDEVLADPSVEVISTPRSPAPARPA